MLLGPITNTYLTYQAQVRVNYTDSQLFGRMNLVHNDQLSIGAELNSTVRNASDSRRLWPVLSTRSGTTSGVKPQLVIGTNSFAVQYEAVNGVCQNCQVLPTVKPGGTPRAPSLSLSLAHSLATALYVMV